MFNGTYDLRHNLSTWKSKCVVMLNMISTSYFKYEYSFHRVNRMTGFRLPAGADAGLETSTGVQPAWYQMGTRVISPG
jgi:hypothetical protein